MFLLLLLSPYPVKRVVFTSSSLFNIQLSLSFEYYTTMLWRLSSLALCAFILSVPVSAQSSAAAASAAPGVTPSASSGATATVPNTGTTLSGSTTTSSSAFNPSAPPDVYLNVPQLSVGRIELDVEELSADINLNAQVANLVTINAGVMVSIETVNLTIADVDAQLELVVRLGHLVDIVNRVFQSLDLNPLLIDALNDVTSIVTTVAGAVSGLLGSITQSGTTLNFLIDNLGNIVQEVVGAAGSTVSTIVGNYLQNMTFTGLEQTLSNGLVQKTYEYTPLNALVDILFNTAGQVVSASVIGTASATGATTTTSGAASATSSGALASTTS